MSGLLTPTAYVAGVGVTLVSCGDCGGYPDRGWVADPFTEDVYGETVMGWWCEGCYYQACMDI